MKALMLIGVGVGLALCGCAAEQPSRPVAEIAPVGTPTSLAPQPSASVSALRLPVAAYSLRPPSAFEVLPYHPSWTVWIVPYRPW